VALMAARWTLQSAQTPAQLFLARVDAMPDATALREKRLGIWRSITWKTYRETVEKLAGAMKELGMVKGDVSSVLSENRPEWVFADMAAMSIGCVGNGIYTTSSPKQVAYYLNDSRSRVVFVEDEEHLDKVLQVRDQCPELRRIVVIETEGLRGFDDSMVMDFPSFLKTGADYAAAHPGFFEDAVGQGMRDDLAILIYTSGTTGLPKAAMIGNSSLMFQIGVADTMMRLGPGDDVLSFLPMCHVAERNTAVFLPLGFGNTINFAESPDTMLENLREVSPTAIFAPPRLWEKMYSTVTLTMKDATWLGRTLYGAALKSGYKIAFAAIEGKRVPALVRLRHRVLDWLALSNVRKAIGVSRAHYALTGAAPVSADLINWFRAIGLSLREAYGLTESVGLATVTPYEAYKPGSCGKPPIGIDVRIAETGEILLRGPNVFSGYLNKPEQTREALDAEGWLHTGDVGALDNEGFLRITDRLKDIIITAGGKNITPSEIENQLKFSPYVSDAVVIGDARPYLTCLIMIDYDNVAKFAQDSHVPFTNYASLCASNEVSELIWQEIEKVNKNVARVETIKKFKLIDVQLTAEDEELTPTMKLKRKLINQKYAPMIEAMYASR